MASPVRALSKPFLLYTAGTPNGHKVSVFLEELKAAYPGKIQYDVNKINIGQNTQKEPWFIRLNPNGRIPVLVDRSREDFVVFETAAILLYLQQHYDTENKFGSGPEQWKQQSEILQWIAFAHGGIGPMMGQAGHFLRAAPEQIPYAQKRYIDETKRLIGVLEIRLKDRDWLVGLGRGTYSIADVNALSWVKGHPRVGVETLDEFPSVKAYLAKWMERPQVKAGIAVPQ